MKKLKELYKMKVTVIPIVVGVFGTVSKNLEKRLDELEKKGRNETILTKVLLKSSRILKRVHKIWRDFLFLRLQWKPSVINCVNNSQKTKSILKNEMHKILCDFEIKMIPDHGTRINLDEKNLSSRGFCYSIGENIRNQNDWQILGSC